MAALRERVAAGDAAGTFALAQRVALSLQTRSFRQHAGDWDVHGDVDTEVPDLLPPGFGDTTTHRPYFETLIVTGIPATSWASLGAASDIEAWMREKSGPDLVSASFVIPYPPGFPIMVPGQVITQETIEFMRKLDVKEIHGYNAVQGLKLGRPEALALFGDRRPPAASFRPAAE